MKKNKRAKHAGKKNEGLGRKILHYILSAMVIVALFLLNSINLSIFLNDGWFYLVYVISFLAGGAFFFLVPGKINALSLKYKFLASVGIAIVVWGILNAYNIYYSKQQPRREAVVSLSDIGIETKGGRIKLYFDVDGSTNSYSGKKVQSIPITHANRQAYQKRLRVRLIYRKGILGSYVLVRPIQVIK